MRGRYFTVGAFALILSSGTAAGQTTGPAGRVSLATLDSALGRLTQMHEMIKQMHPLLADLHPVAIVEGDSLMIFDTGTDGTSYHFQLKAPVPFPMQKGIRASFPLSSYGNRPTCVVSPEVFETAGGYATIFHEFVHCAQALSCENSLKEKLHVARAALAAKEYSWEINRKFPYSDSAFVEAYSRFLSSLRDSTPGDVQSACRDLKKNLAPDDYEYLVWVEWKEGLARYFENRIRRSCGLEPNLAGRDRPYDRVSFYYGGESLISYIAAHNPDALRSPEKLFGVMFAPDSER